MIREITKHRITVNHEYLRLLYNISLDYNIDRVRAYNKIDAWVESMSDETIEDLYSSVIGMSTRQQTLNLMISEIKNWDIIPTLQGYTTPYLYDAYNNFNKRG